MRFKSSTAMVLFASFYVGLGNCSVSAEQIYVDLPIKTSFDAALVNKNADILGLYLGESPETAKNKLNEYKLWNMERRSYWATFGGYNQVEIITREARAYDVFVQQPNKDTEDDVNVYYSSTMSGGNITGILRNIRFDGMTAPPDISTTLNSVLSKYGKPSELSEQKRYIFACWAFKKTALVPMSGCQNYFKIDLSYTASDLDKDLVALQATGVSSLLRVYIEKYSNPKVAVLSFMLVDIDKMIEDKASMRSFMQNEAEKELKKRNINTNAPKP